MAHLNLCEHVGGGKNSRFTVDGIRVARDVFFNLEWAANRSDCFITKIDEQTGRIRNYKSIVVVDSYAKTVGVI